MAGFRIGSNSINGIWAWEGYPNDDDAHRRILDCLHAAVSVGFLDPLEPLSNRTKGNLGEFISLIVGKDHVFTDEVRAEPANAQNPLFDKSESGIDIVWLYFGDTETDDWVALQEVKTTGSASLGLALDIVADYEKLFGENLRLTLQARLDAIKNKLEWRGQGEFAPRLTSLVGPTPGSVRGIRIFPTLVHDSASNSYENMNHVRQCLICQGWSPEFVHCWSISLSDLNDRLSRLARGQP